MWGLLLRLPATTPHVQAVRQRAQQLFLSGVTHSVPQIAESFLGSHGSGALAVENLQAIATFVHGAGEKHPALEMALVRMEATHITRAVKAGNVELIQATLNLGPVDRDMGGETHRSWIRQWAQAARENIATETMASTLDALLKAGVDINAADSEGSTALDWLLDGRKILAQDSYRMGARIGKPLHLDSSEATNLAFEASAPVAGLLLERGARWNHLDIAQLHPHAVAILEGHPVVRRARLATQVDTHIDRPSLGKHSL
jgi:hypothetical protein